MAAECSPKSPTEKESEFSNSVFSIIGVGKIKEKLKAIDESAFPENRNWFPADHVEEFGKLTKHFLFIAQGNPKAPVTSSNIVDRIHEHLIRASTFENIAEWIFWTPEQLTVINTLHIQYMFLDAFYSVGKSSMLQHIARHWSNEPCK